MSVSNIYLSIIGTALISCFWCIGVHAVIVKLFIEEWFGYPTVESFWNNQTRVWKIIFKPMWACPACMASVHGTVIYFIFLFPLIGFWYWLPFCICLCGLNFFVSQFFNE